MKQLQYRRAKKQDIDWIYPLFEAGMRVYIEATWGWDELFQRHSFTENLPASAITVISRGDVDIGAYSLKNQSEQHHLEILLIAANWQNQGYGTQVVETLQAQAAAENKPLTLSVLKSNPAIHLYQRLGFSISSEDNDRYRLIWSAGKEPSASKEPSARKKS